MKQEELAIEKMRCCISESILDTPQRSLDENVWMRTDDGKSFELKPEARQKLEFIMKHLADRAGLEEFNANITGSITSNSFTDDSDIDLHFSSEEAKKEDADDMNIKLRDVFEQLKLNADDDAWHIGSHPVEVYFQSNPFQDLMSVGCYSLTQHKWLVGPEFTDIKFNPYSEYFKKDMKYVDKIISDIRDIILKVYEIALVIGKLDGVEKQQQEEELEKQVGRAAALFQNARKMRKHLSSPKSAEEALKYRNDKKWKIADSAFKLMDKFGYLAILRECAKMHEDGSVDADQIVDVVRASLGENNKKLHEIDDESIADNQHAASATPEYDRVYNEVLDCISQADDTLFGVKDKLNRGNKCILLWHGDVKKDRFGFDDYSECDKAWDPKNSWGLVEVQTFPYKEDLTHDEADAAIERARSFILKHSLQPIDEGAREAVSAGMLAALLAVPGILAAKNVQKAINSNQKYELVMKDLNQDVRMVGSYTAFQAANIIARTLYAEARNDGRTGMEAVASVIYNRAKGDKTLFTNACLKPMQFSCWNKFTKEEADPKNFKIKIPSSVNGNKKNEALWKEAMQIAADMLADAFKPITDANMYFNPQKCSPRWSKDLTSTTMIGSHKFGKLKNHSPFV